MLRNMLLNLLVILFSTPLLSAAIPASTQPTAPAVHRAASVPRHGTIFPGTPVSTLDVPFATPNPMTLARTFPPDTFLRVRPAGGSDSELCPYVRSGANGVRRGGGCASDAATFKFHAHEDYYFALPWIPSTSGMYPGRLYPKAPTNCDYKNNTYWCW